MIGTVYSEWHLRQKLQKNEDEDEYDEDEDEDEEDRELEKMKSQNDFMSRAARSMGRIAERHTKSRTAILDFQDGMFWMVAIMTLVVVNVTLAMSRTEDEPPDQALDDFELVSTVVFAIDVFVRMWIEGIFYERALLV